MFFAEKIELGSLKTLDEISIDDMRATLSIYRALFEEIYASQPHFRVLYLLHGDAEELSVDHLKSASGIGKRLNLESVAVPS